MPETRTPNPWLAGRLTAGRSARVMFGRMYEDHAVELGLLAPRSRVLAIASAGDTVAALAAAGHRVTAVDVSAAQLAYARGRLGGARAADGTAESILKIARRSAAVVVPGWRRAALEEFLGLEDPTAQAAHWRRHLDRPMLRALMFTALGSTRPVATVLDRGFRAGLADLIPPRFDRALRRRLEAGLGRYPNRTNPWARRLLLGDTGAVAPAQPSDVDWVRAEVVAHLRQVPAGTYDAVTLSNVLDGPPPAFAVDLVEALRHAVRFGGTAILRTFRDSSPLPGRHLPDRSLLWGATVAVDL
ncbi:DUF3419 family protein [Dactylosporangium sp. NPDC051541]|uniref:DUF3419 family protein n=1 Tax=Dactylosporangium sp. NPDC051541 TaxID=3363977 RepID=UPI0037B473D0